MQLASLKKDIDLVVFNQEALSEILNQVSYSACVTYSWIVGFMWTNQSNFLHVN